MNLIAISFIFFLLLFAVIGMASMKFKTEETTDYLLANRSINPWAAALSAVATNNSGFMFIGLIGMAYSIGLSAAWIMIGWVGGDFLTWFFVHKRLRLNSEERAANTFSAMLGGYYPSRADGRQPVTVAAAVLTLLFLGTYAAAQLTAGSKALNVLFGWPYATGAIIGAALVAFYCYAGGIRASIWTDVAQSIVMFVAMILLLITSQFALGGPVAFVHALYGIDPHLASLWPQHTALGPLLFCLGWFFGGLGTVGQPHIMVRFMTLADAQQMKAARNIYISWYTLFAIGAVLVGAATRVLLPELQGMDPELALPALAETLLPQILIGLTLAAIFAATISTADSQILSASAALTQDLFPQWANDYRLAKFGTLGVTALVLLIALVGPGSVFFMVTLSWAVLGATLAPLLVLHLFGRTPAQTVALAMMATGLIVVMLWEYYWQLGNAVYSIMPGMLAALAVGLLHPSTWRETDAEVQAENQAE